MCIFDRLGNGLIITLLAAELNISNAHLGQNLNVDLQFIIFG